MSKMGFLQNEENTKDTVQPLPKQNSLTIGETGSGKTVGILYPIIKQKLSVSGCLIVDEKHTMHTFVKHCVGVNNFDRVYQLGSSVSMGTNDLEVNLLSLACGSKKATKEFFDGLMGVHITDSHNTHDFWAQSASTMIAETYQYLHSIKSFLQFMEKEMDVERQLWSYATKINTDEESKIFVKFSIDSTPLTLRSLYAYMSNKDIFIAFATEAETIISRIAKHFDTSNNERVTSNKMLQLNHYYNEMKDASMKMHKHILPYDMSAEASGIRGVYFTLMASLGGDIVDIDCLNASISPLDMLTLLEGGKHIIVNSESLPVLATNVIVSRTLELLSLRAKRQNPAHVTFIVDEASRVLSRASDLDRVLSFCREASISVHLATQAESQLVELFGSLKYDAMKTNFGDIYTLSSKEHPLETFYYNSKRDGKVLLTEPIFVGKKDLLATEKEYQVKTRQFKELEMEEGEVVIYDARLYEEKHLLLVVDMHTLEEHELYYLVEDKKRVAFFKKKDSHTKHHIVS